MASVVVVGGGIAGLSAALTLSRTGHAVTLLERDDTPMPASADEAFWWDRRGAPQVRHSHAFLARLYTILRDRYPDVLADLLAAGATEVRFGADLPPTLVGFEPMPGDEDIVMIACRRTTFEWVLRQTVMRTRAATIQTGVAVDGLLAEAGHRSGTPIVITGIHLDNGETIRADHVVVAAGRRGDISGWLTAVGAPPLDESVEDTGIVYLSRFYRLGDDADFPPRAGPIGGDLGYLKYGVFAGDNRTFSVTLAVPTDDSELRKQLAETEFFDACGRGLVATAPWLDGRSLPLTDQVHVMAGLINRWRQFVVDGHPVALGLHAVGDALVCTNPLYGRGCTTALWSAQLLADALGGPGDAETQSLAYLAAVDQQIAPWYRAAVQQDADARRVAAALLAGSDPDADASDPRTFIRGVFRDGLAPAMRTDPVVFRAVFRNFNLLTSPEALLNDADVASRVLAVWNDRANRPPEPKLGPTTRAELITRLAGAAAPAV